MLSASFSKCRKNFSTSFSLNFGTNLMFLTASFPSDSCLPVLCCNSAILISFSKANCNSLSFILSSNSFNSLSSFFFFLFSFSLSFSLSLSLLAFLSLSPLSLSCISLSLSLFLAFLSFFLSFSFLDFPLFLSFSFLDFQPFSFPTHILYLSFLSCCCLPSSVQPLFQTTTLLSQVFHKPQPLTCTLLVCFVTLILRYSANLSSSSFLRTSTSSRLTFSLRNSSALELHFLQFSLANNMHLLLFRDLDTLLSLLVSTCNRFQFLTNFNHLQALSTFITDTFKTLATSTFNTFNHWQFQLRHIHSLKHSNPGQISSPTLLSTPQRSLPDDFTSGTSFNTATFSPDGLYARHFFNTATFTPGRAPNFLLRTNLKYANKKNTNIAVSILCIYFHLFTYIQCINDIHYAASSCFSLNTCYHCCLS